MKKLLSILLSALLLLTPIILTSCDATDGLEEVFDGFEEIVYELEGLFEGIEDIIEDIDNVLEDGEYDGYDEYYGVGNEDFSDKYENGYNNGAFESADKNYSDGEMNNGNHVDDGSDNGSTDGGSTFYYDGIAFNYGPDFKDNGYGTFVDRLGNNFTVSQMPKNEELQNMDEKVFQELMVPELNAQNIYTSDVEVTKMRNVFGVYMNFISFTNTAIVSGYRNVTYQTLIIVTNGDYTYLITVTEVRPDTIYAEGISSSLKLLDETETPKDEVAYPDSDFIIDSENSYNTY